MSQTFSRQRLSITHGTHAERQAVTLKPTELWQTTEDGSLYIGNGQTAGGVLVTAEGSPSSIDGGEP